jgi:hypothetical protein
MLRSMILGMVRELLVPLLLVGAMSAQNSQPLKVRIAFPEGLTEKASMTYLRRDAVQANSHGYYGVSFHADDSFVEVPATTEQFTALVWAPGCKMKHLNVPVALIDLVASGSEPNHANDICGRADNRHQPPFATDQSCDQGSE